MQYLAAYALVWLSGKASPSIKDLEAILKAAGGEFKADQAESLVEALKDKSIHEVISAGKGKLSGISLSGSGSAPTETKAAGAEKKKEKKEEKSGDEDAGLTGGMGLFGDEEW